MEKGPTKNQRSCLRLLALVSSLCWLCLFYVHFIVLGGTSVDDIMFDSNSAPLNAISIKNHLSRPVSVKRIIRTEKEGLADVVSKNVIQNEAPWIPSKKGLVKTKDKPPNKMMNYPFMRALRTVENKSDPCGGKYIYVHDLPSMFNENMVKECKSLSLWTDMCKFITNFGLGPPLENVEGVFSNTGWYATNQFALDLIFSNRMKQYKCLTNDSSLAAAIFVPFYAGFDISRYLWGHNMTTRDAASLALIEWLVKRPEWQIMGGRDHFLVAGRITWDFRRLTDQESDWGNKLLFLPPVKNMSVLVVESSPWHMNDYGIPYPTYFHPEKDSDLSIWLDRMRKQERKHLFCFAGAPRPGNKNSIRGQIIEQCKNSNSCQLLECGFGESKCHSPGQIMQMFQSSHFCLQPQGDSFTRRSAFDSILAGCIPVFFHPASAYTQYTWHLPKNYTKYSVFIPEDDVRIKKISLEERLNEISAEQVKEMRDMVINLIPQLIYADPRSDSNAFKDAFDIAVEAIIKKVTKLRRDVVEGQDYGNFIEELTWKYALDKDQAEKPHAWDPFFSKTKKNIVSSLRTRANSTRD
ncbi:xyloglucan galactosyltransferase MUR3 [Primulina tabacum]|uniref:xyloglucan galactosyltransferase MUR3 n=1 Tax=Primulina tabacum TaxID=48773 RepID=UPI003F59E1D9